MFTLTISDKIKVISFVSTLIFIFGRKPMVVGCGDRLGKGIIMCYMEDANIVDQFDPELCTHVNIGTNEFVCTRDACWPNPNKEFENTVEQLRPHLSGRFGFRIRFNEELIDSLSTRLKRINSAKKTITFMEERGFSFIVFQEKSVEADFIRNISDRHSTKFIQEIARAAHSRGWHIGLDIMAGRTELGVQYDFVTLSEIVDWFNLWAFKNPERDYIHPFVPTSPLNELGTTDYWIKHVLEWLQPECILLYIQIIGNKFTAKEIAVEPGPGSKASADKVEFFNIAEVCEYIKIHDCRTYWDNYTGTPWAACGNDYYSYVDPKSMELKTELARRYKIAGMSVQVSTEFIGSELCGHQDSFVFLRAVQGIRNVSSRSKE